MNQLLIKTKDQQTFFGKGEVAIILSFVEQTVPTDTTQPSSVARKHVKMRENDCFPIKLYFQSQLLMPWA